MFKSNERERRRIYGFWSHNIHLSANNIPISNKLIATKFKMISCFILITGYFSCYLFRLNGNGEKYIVTEASIKTLIWIGKNKPLYYLMAAIESPPIQICFSSTTFQFEWSPALTDWCTTIFLWYNYLRRQLSEKKIIKSIEMVLLIEWTDTHRNK